jgi:uncharacterized protein YndB with AHSA1/START domain
MRLEHLTDQNEETAAQQASPLRLSRIFHARPQTVFKAWSSAKHVKHWFSPETYRVSDAAVEMHVGGAFDVCMRSPSGTEHWTRGTFIEVTPCTRLVIEMRVAGGNGEPLFRAYTEVNFAEVLGGTRMDVVQTYTFIDPKIAAPMVAGAPEGWRTTLDKLDAEVVAMEGGKTENGTCVVHSTFQLERTYDAPLARVWSALTDEAAKQKWFGGTPGQWELLERSMDVRVGGRERVKGRWAGGVVSTFDAIYHDVIPNARIVYTYEMHLDTKKISVSLATMQLEADDGSTTLRVTEQGAFLDGYDDAGSREQGTGHLLDALGASLRD